MEAAVLPFTALICLVTAVIPVVHVEAYLVVVATQVPSWQLPWLVVIAATAQVAGKVWLFQAGRDVTGRLFRKYAARREQLRERVAGGPVLRGALVSTSALIGLPPFYAVSVLAGSIGIPLPEFVLYGLLGRLVRFGVLVFLPHLFWKAL